MFDLFFIGLLLIILGGIVSIFFKENIKGFIVFFFMGIGVVLILIPSFNVLFGLQNLTREIYFPYPIKIVKFIIDPLSSFFVILFSIMSFIGTIYSAGYMKIYCNTNRTVGSHYLFLSLLVSSMILVVTIQNAIAFLIIWEIMSLSSFFLILFENEKKEVFDAGINYLITMHIGVAFLITGFIFLSIKANGSFDFEFFKNYLVKNNKTANILFILFFTGFGIKAGFMPLHTWLPKAHPAGPSNVSGIMSGIMIKTGIYGILRIIYLIGNPSIYISYFVLGISLLTGLFGIMYAISQNDYKKILAYSSVENIGLIGIGIGIGMLGLVYKNNFMSMLGFLGAFFHILNHSIFKMLLFFSLGGVYQKTKTRNIEKLGGLIEKMKFTSIFFLIGSLSICGLPLFNGFISEFFLYFGFLKGIGHDNLLLSVVLIISTAIVSFIGCMALLCFTKVFGIIFLGTPRCETYKDIKDVNIFMILPMFLLSIFCIIIGLFPQSILYALMSVINFFGIETYLPFLNINNLVNTISFYFLIFITMLFSIFFIRYLLLRKKSIYQYKTWDCGYQAGNPRMQYTSSSFSKSFLFLINPLIRKQFNIKKPDGLFPEKASFESESKDIIEIHIINPSLKFIKKFLELFSWIQSGETGKYIMYGLIFLVLIITAVIGLELIKTGRF